MMEDTIAAVVTAMGTSSVGIIRLSGPEACEISQMVYQGKADLRRVPSHSISYGFVYDRARDKMVDEALFMVMRGPHSFTGEDVVEIQSHGGTVVLQKILSLVLAQGARLADPGEYSKRAFLNGKMDLAQAEAVMDIVEAKTETSLDLALTHLQGGLSQKIQGMREALLELIAFIQADIDFPDDDIQRLSADEQRTRLLDMMAQIRDILKTAQRGQIIRDGLRVVIVGKPNVGKSSLLNSLLGQNRAIVTDIPGTTRDTLEEMINLNGIPLKVVDTAGIHETDNLVEQMGVNKAKAFLQVADLVLYVFAAQEGLNEADREIISLMGESQALIFLQNKMDLGYSPEVERETLAMVAKRPLVELSLTLGQGLDTLEEAIMMMFFEGRVEVSQEVMISNIRHITVLNDCLDHLNSVVEGIDLGITTDFLVIDCQSAWEKLGKITGETIEDDLLDQIFSKFCLGK